MSRLSLRSPGAWMIGITLAGFLLRAIHSGHSGFWVDEISTVQCISGSWAHLWRSLSHAPSDLLYSNANTNPPFYFLLLWVWCKIFGLGEMAVRMPSVLFGTLTIPLCGRIARQLKDQNAGLLAALLLALHPAHVVYSREARPYTLALFLLFLLTHLALRLAGNCPPRGGPRWYWRTRRQGLAENCLPTAGPAVLAHPAQGLAENCLPTAGPAVLAHPAQGLEDPRTRPKNGIRLSLGFSLCAAALAMTQYHLIPLALLLYGWLLSQKNAPGKALGLGLLLPTALLVAWLPAIAEQLSDGSAFYFTGGFRLVFDPDNTGLTARILLLLSGLASTDFAVPLTTDYLPLWGLLAVSGVFAVLIPVYLRSVGKLRLLWIFLAYAAFLFIRDALNPSLYARYLLFFIPSFLIVASCALAGYPRRTVAALTLVLAAGWASADWAVVKPLWDKSKERELSRELLIVKGDAPAFLVCFPGFFRDSLFYYMKTPSPPRPVNAPSGDVPSRPAKILVVDLYPNQLDDAKFLDVLKALHLKRVKMLRWDPLNRSDRKAYGIVFEAEHPRESIAAIETALKRHRLPFDPYPVWKI